MTDIIGPLPEGVERQPVLQPDAGPGAGTRNMPAPLRAELEQEGDDDGSEMVAGAVSDHPAG